MEFAKDCLLYFFLRYVDAVFDPKSPQTHKTATSKDKATIDTQDAQLLETCEKAYDTEYSTMWENWKHLDSKAQVSVTLAGVLLGALLTIAKIKDHTPLPTDASVALVLAIGLTMLATVISAMALFVRAARGKPSASALYQTILELGESEIPASELHPYNGLLYQKLDEWKKACESINEKIEDKAFLVFSSQLTLVLSVLLVGYAGIRVIST